MKTNLIECYPDPTGRSDQSGPSCGCSGNNLLGAIPTWLGNLTKLTTLSLGENNLSGAIPTELGNLTKLTYLALNNNQLTGAIPTQLGDLTNLETLALVATTCRVLSLPNWAN